MPRRKRRIKKAGRSPLVTHLFSVSPSKSSCRFLLSFADSHDAARVAPRFPRRFCCALELPDGIPIIINKDNCPLIVWQCWSAGLSLVCNLRFHTNPSTVIWGIRAVVVDAIESASHARGIVVISSRQCPFLERRKITLPLVTDGYSSSAISRIIRRVFVKTPRFHAAPHTVQAVTLCWYVCIQLVDALFHGFCDCFWSGAITAGERSSRSQPLTRHASYCSALASAYPSNLFATFVKTKYRPLANSLPRKVFCPLTSLPMKHCVAEPTSARLLPSTFYILYRCINSVPASTFELPNWAVATISANWSNRGKPAKRLPRVILDKSTSCWVLDFCHRVLLGGCCA